MMNINKKRELTIIKMLLVIFFIFLGSILLYFNNNSIELLLGAFFLILGVIIFLYFIKTTRSSNLNPNLTDFDERSEINRLKAADLSFKFLFLTINGLLIIYALNPITIEIFIALLSPLMAFAIVIYFGYYYWNERGIE